jgi:DNA-binding LytR/AlgR family response regulator
LEREVSSGRELEDGTENQEPPPYQAPLKSPIVRRALISVAAYVLLLTLIGIIYKDELSWSRRTAYLAVCALLSIPICIFYGILMDHLARLRARVTSAVSLVGSALLSASSATVLVYGVDRLFRAGFMPNRMRDPYVLALVGLLVFASVAQYAMVRRQRWEDTLPRVEEARSGGEPQAGEGPTGKVEEQPETPGTYFFRRLPRALGRDLIYLKMSDHYVDVFTTAGHTVLLMRLGDAVAELEGLGMRVHRSYWVGHGHAERLLRRGRRRLLRLTDGPDVPVSRTYLAAVEAALKAETRNS